ncbi:MAG: hypothetical protein KIS78_03195 [Labilithrix sp.]|nr:hypothetical protein [Labilithrix sp.]
MDARVAEAAELMTRFAERTGLTSDAPGRRYLWTDAFAVCNFLSLAHATRDGAYHELGLRLVDRVHDELGRHRADDRRRGWLSGLPDAEARAHPTRGGLRIGKPLPERSEGERLDPDLEWDRDGQYFHYLTKWMHALDQAARWTGDVRLNVWACELAVTAHRAFVHGGAGRKRMVWKLSVDLSRPLVPSMGHHDPLDGFVTCKRLEATARALGSAASPDLTSAIADFGGMIDEAALATDDPLGLGGLLLDAYRLSEVDAESELIRHLLDASVVGLHAYVSASTLRAPAYRRLGFRELGLALGLAAASRIDGSVLAESLGAGVRDRVCELQRWAALGAAIASYWLGRDPRRAPTWVEHQDISDVMLATCLVPDGFLALGEPRGAGPADAPAAPPPAP